MFCRFGKKSHYHISALINQTRDSKDSTCLPVIVIRDQCDFYRDALSDQSQYYNSRRAFTNQVEVQLAREEPPGFVQMFGKKANRSARRALLADVTVNNFSWGKRASPVECIRCCYRNTRIANNRSHAGHQSTRQWDSRETSAA